MESMLRGLLTVVWQILARNCSANPLYFGQKTSNLVLLKPCASASIQPFGKDDLCNHENNHKFAASAAVQNETGNFTHRTRNEARPLGRAPKRSCEGIPVPVLGRE